MTSPIIFNHKPLKIRGGKEKRMGIGLRIGKYLKDRGITQSFLVRETGLTASAISDICSGTRKGIECLEYYKICKALGVDLMTFIAEGDSEV